MIEGLFEHGQSSVLPGKHVQRWVDQCAHEHRRNSQPAGHEFLQHFQARHILQVEVENKTIALLQDVVFKKKSSRSIVVNILVDRLQQQHQRVAHRIVVLNNKDLATCIVHDQPTEMFTFYVP